MKRLEETRGALFELVRHFLARMFDSDLFATAGQGRSAAIGAFALVIPVGMLVLDPSYSAKYRVLSALPSPAAFRAAALADGLSLATLIFSIIGLMAILQWQSLFPGTRDFLALAGLPVRPRQIFCARLMAVLAFSLGVVVAINILPSLLMPMQLSGRWQRGIPFLARVVARGVSFGLGSLFVFGSIVALQGLLLNLLPGRWFSRVAVWVQGAITAALLFAGLFSPSIGDWSPEQIALLPRYGTWAPPVWYAGLHEWLLGDTDPFYHAMAVRGLAALGWSALLIAVTYLVTYRRYRRLLLEAPHQVGPSHSRRWPLTRLLARNPQQEAILSFMTGVLSRSRTHRLVLLACLGGTLGFLVNSALLSGVSLHAITNWRGSLRIVPAFWPLASSAIVLAGLRHVFSMPVELRANWVFRLTESYGRADWMEAVERFVLVYAVLPIHLLLFPLSAAIFGFALATKMMVLQVLVSLIFFEFLFRSWQQLPFACSYVPGKRPVVAVLASYVTVLGGVAPVVSILIGTASQVTAGFVIFLAIFTTTWLCTRRARRDGWGEAPLYYEDCDGAVPDLGISEITFHRPLST